LSYILTAVLEFLFQIVVEVIGQILFEVLFGVGSESLKHSGRRGGRSHPALAAIGHFLMGMIAGGVSLLLFNERLLAPSAFPGLSLLLSPLGTGAAMHVLGARWEHDDERPRLFSFRAGAIFAFGMALVRFSYFEFYLAR
jgi:hypothetical protein